MKVFELVLCDALAIFYRPQGPKFAVEINVRNYSRYTSLIRGDLLENIGRSCTFRDSRKISQKGPTAATSLRCNSSQFALGLF